MPGKRELVVPGEKDWVSVNIPVIDATLYDGAHISIPAHVIQVATHYPTYEDGSLVGGMTQAQVAQFLHKYNSAHGTDFRYPMLFEDEAMRDQFGRKHATFGENVEHNDVPRRWGYVADFTRRCGGGMVEGINGQMLVTRLVGYRLPKGEQILGVATIAPSGVVPKLSRKQLEKMIGADGLKRLEELRGREIYEKRDEVVDVRNALRYPQLTLRYPQLTLGPDERLEEGKVLPHSHHFYAPGQNDRETEGSRGISRYLHGRRMCFSVNLGCTTGLVSPDKSFPLVREVA